MFMVVFQLGFAWTTSALKDTAESRTIETIEACSMKDSFSYIIILRLFYELMKCAAVWICESAKAHLPSYKA